MADIAADYEGIAETCSTFVAQCNIIIPEIYSLLERVGNLLDEGLYLEQASPALKAAYTEFSQSLHSAAGNLQSYANIFTQIKDNFENNDAALFAGTLSSLDGEGGLELEPEEVTSETPDPPEWDDSKNIGGTALTWNEDGTQITSVGK
ncbi:hypothetical protein [Streptomyces sp. 7-21]|jgi:hypothetical protein|uniref:hypothetical protein n=1 Tax=Streptomyces sp. 7-21 TaxID=2802283 RepID=UPI00191D714A|nr:hypothetical protein [Streptomyces sp. 7-21]MBL1066194.1 hypothetical protein [Streptomyces sp. 7-21]